MSKVSTAPSKREIDHVLPKCSEILTRVRKRPRRRGERPNKLSAIRNFCLECMGYDVGEVAACSSPKCWLYTWRFGTTPEKAERRGHDAR